MPHLKLAHRITQSNSFHSRLPFSSGIRASRVDLSQRSPNNDLRVARRREHPDSRSGQRETVKN
jgi:hypothetical protein